MIDLEVEIKPNFGFLIFIIFTIITSIGAIFQEIPKLSSVERQSLILELQRQDHLMASNEFARLFQGVSEIEMWTPVVSNEDMDYFMHVHEVEKGKLCCRYKQKMASKIIFDYAAVILEITVQMTETMMIVQ